MTSQTVRVLTSFALLTLACQPAGRSLPCPSRLPEEQRVTAPLKAWKR